MAYDDSIYQDIRQHFAGLDETDMQEAFLLAKRAADAKEYYEEQLHEYSRLASGLKHDITRTHAKISFEESPENVAKGNRIADNSDVINGLRRELDRTQYFVGQLQARVNFLGNVHFTAKSAFENAAKKYRQEG